MRGWSASSAQRSHRLYAEQSTDPLKPGDDTFTYDKVSRLTQATIATGASTSVSQAYAYDAWGNLTSYGGQPRAVVGSTNHLADASYDGAGNQTGWLFNTGLNRYTYIYDYDRLNQMRYVNGPDGQHRVYAYTADGERVVERDVVGGTTTFTLRGLDGALLREIELKNGAYDWVKDYVYRDGQLLASQHRTEGHQHYHLDHLGTTRMLTNRCGERVKRYEQFPYGDTISAPSNDTETRRFTGHQRDIGSTSNTNDDLEYMHARYYGPLTARFLSVDQGNGIAAMPQSWNRYAYVRANPLTAIDPDGKEPLNVHMRVFLEAFLHADLSRVHVFGGWFARTLTQIAGARGITFGQYIFFDRPSFAEYQTRSLEGVVLTGHEATHTVQYATQGFFTFLKTYLGDYITNRRAGMSPYDAYRNTGAEKGAYANDKVLRTFLTLNLSILVAIQQGTPLTEAQLALVREALPPPAPNEPRQMPTRRASGGDEGILNLGQNLYCIDGACF